MLKLLVLINVVVLAAARQVPRISPRIINGNQVNDIQDAAYQVDISIYPTLTLTEKYCNGALISDKYVLTAASCFKDLAPRHVVVLQFGAVNLRNTTISRIATDVYKHLKFDASTLQNNLALVRFPPVPLSNQIQTIRLPTFAQQSESYEGRSAVVSGRGEDIDWSGTVSPTTPKRILRTSSTTVVTNTVCKTTQVVPDNVVNTNICTADNARLCLGDEGSLLYVTENGIKTLIGIGSYENRLCTTEVRNAVFTRVTSYLTWISLLTLIPIPAE